MPSMQIHRFSPLLAVAFATLTGCAGMGDSRSFSAPKTVSESESAGNAINLNISPLGLAMNDDGSRLYVPDNKGNAIIIFDTEQRSVVNRIEGETFPPDDSGCPDNLCRGRGAAGISIGKAERIAVASSLTADSVSVIDLTSGDITKTIPVERFPRDIVLSHDGKIAYAFNGVADTISVVNVDTGETVGEAIDIGGKGAGRQPFGRPLGLWLAPDDSRLFAYDAYGHAIIAIDTQTRAREDAIPLARRLDGLALSADGKDIAVLDEEGLTVRDAGSLKVRHTLPWCVPGNRYPANIALSDGGRYLAIAEAFAPRTQIIDSASGEVIGSYANDKPLSELAFSPDISVLYALDYKGTLNVIDPLKSAPLREEDRRVFCPDENKKET